MKWREATGLLCNIQVPLKEKENLYKTIEANDNVRVEVLGIKEKIKNKIKIEVAKMKTLR